jgi:hypothetical protein
MSRTVWPGNNWHNDFMHSTLHSIPATCPYYSAGLKRKSLAHTFAQRGQCSNAAHLTEVAPRDAPCTTGFPITPLRGTMWKYGTHRVSNTSTDCRERVSETWQQRVRVHG